MLPPFHPFEEDPRAKKAFVALDFHNVQIYITSQARDYPVGGRMITLETPDGPITPGDLVRELESPALEGPGAGGKRYSDNERARILAVVNTLYCPVDDQGAPVHNNPVALWDAPFPDRPMQRRAAFRLKLDEAQRLAAAMPRL